MSTTMTPPPTRKLTRSNRDSKVAGVSGGLGEYFGIDPVIFRLAFVVAAFAGGTGLLAYIIAWIVLPEADDADQSPPAPSGTFSPPVIIGALLIVAGVVTLVDSSSWFGLDIDGPIFIWPVGLLVAGALLIFRGRDDEPQTTPTSTSTTTANPGAAAPTATTGDTTTGDPTTGDPLASTAMALYEGGVTRYESDDTDGIDDADLVDTPAEPATGADGGGPGDGSGHYWSDAVDPAPEPAPQAEMKKRRFSPTRLAFGGLLVFFGIVGLAFIFDWFSLGLTAILAIALVIVGAGLIAGAIWGGGWPLLPLGVVIAVLLTGSAAAGDVDLSGGVGNSIERPTAGTTDLTFDWGIGEMTIDLRDLLAEVEAGETVAITAEQGIGELEIIVPDDVGIILDAEVGMGEIEVYLPSDDLFIEEGGIRQDQRLDRSVEGETVVEITADLGFGQIYVHEG